MADSTPTTCDADGTCYCPLASVLDTLSGKYAMGVLSIVDAHGPVRFAEIERRLPSASASTVSTRLKELRETGLLVRTQYDEIPPRVEYELTDDGKDVRGRLDPLLDWVTETER
ncbi:helix-turn-helix domain-containing protein [Halalkalicoccus sp. NIPERK01]|uniref:winged helix-turn-helix transcriptional regulator n=1 Tax=Halalkalicoccus sp. NIPERK01 TaxID=3053469 RepID=UPI00256EF1F8|nr:helix-turn-helix domain-containing protein [Halalkalicoccus sp. NIPERK01]MDL5361579.1 helix-turn-helix domain-containing protein [Halalkalicoccus sp. NIPERK01]